jgi:hypothetical protein
MGLTLEVLDPARMKKLDVMLATLNFDVVRKEAVHAGI